MKQLVVMLTDSASGIQGGYSRGGLFLCFISVLTHPPPPTPSKSLGQDLKSGSGDALTGLGVLAVGGASAPLPVASPVSWAFSQLVAGSEGEHPRDGELSRSYQLFCDPAWDVTKRLLAHALLVGVVTRSRPDSKGGSTDPASPRKGCQ